jgi:hypothetical protein
MTMAPPASSCLWANGTLMAHGRRLRTNGLDTRDQREPLTWCFRCGAGDGNRTRTISLGIGQIAAGNTADQATRGTWSSRG